MSGVTRYKFYHERVPGGIDAGIKADLEGNYVSFKHFEQMRRAVADATAYAWTYENQQKWEAKHAEAIKIAEGQ